MTSAVSVPGTKLTGSATFRVMKRSRLAASRLPACEYDDQGQAGLSLGGGQLAWRGIRPRGTVISPQHELPAVVISARPAAFARQAGMAESGDELAAGSPLGGTEI